MPCADRQITHDDVPEIAAWREDRHEEVQLGLAMSYVVGTLRDAAEAGDAQAAELLARMRRALRVASAERSEQ